MRIRHAIFWGKKSAGLKLLHKRWAEERKIVPSIARSLDGYHAIKGFRVCRPHYWRVGFVAPFPSWKMDAGKYLREKRVNQLRKIKPESARLAYTIKHNYDYVAFIQRR